MGCDITNIVKACYNSEGQQLRRAQKSTSQQPGTTKSQDTTLTLDNSAQPSRTIPTFKKVFLSTVSKHCISRLEVLYVQDVPDEC